MFNIGMPELIIIFLVALVVFGPRRLPQIGRVIGRALNEFRKGMQELNKAIQQEPSEEINKEDKPCTGTVHGKEEIEKRAGQRNQRQDA